MDHVLKLCVRHIMKTADLEYTECAYEIPEIVLGLPLYDIGNVVSYLREKLLERGFRVAYIFPRVLIISWRNQKTERNLHAQQIFPISSRNPDPVDEQHVVKQVTSQPVDVRIGPPKPINTSHIRSIETSSFGPPMKCQKQNTPFHVPYIKPIAELKPSGRFVLDLT